MLNFLISVISDTYRRVTERNKMHTYRYRNQLNIEYLGIRDRFLKPMKINCLLLVTNHDDYQMEEDNFSEIKDQIIEVVKENHIETKESIHQMD
jgi:hypothetical protein